MLKQFVLVTLFVGFLQADYLTKDVKTKDVRVYQGAKVEVVKKEGKKVTLKLKGAILNSYQKAIYIQKGFRVKMAGIRGKIPDSVKVLKVEKDAYKKDWSIVEFTFQTDAKNVEPKLEIAFAATNEFFSNVCSACHTAPQIGHFNPNQWPGIVKSMAQRSGMSKKDTKAMTKFLQLKSFELSKKGEH